MTTAFTNQLVMFGSLALDITSGKSQLPWTAINNLLAEMHTALRGK